MVAKLKLALREVPWPLAARAAGVAVLWMLMPMWLWLPVAAIIILQNRQDPKHTYGRFIMSLLLLALAGDLILEEGLYYLMAAVIAALTGLLVGLREIWFRERLVGARMFAGLAAASLWPLFFYMAGGEGSLGWWLVFVTAITYWLNTELIGLLTETEERQRLLSWGVTLMTMEVAWGLFLLPIGFLFQTASMLIFNVVVVEFVLNNRKRIDNNETLWLITVGVLLWAVVLMLGNWEL